MANDFSSSDNYRHVLKYTSIFGSVQGLNILIGLVRNKVIALLLGPGGMGLVSLFNTISTFISQATSLGISFSAVRRISELYDTGDSSLLRHYAKVVRGWTLLITLAGFLLSIVLSPLFNKLSFSWGDHTLHYALLAPAIAMMAITGCETAILKGTRCLRALATVQVSTAILVLLTTTPLYYFFGESAIVPVITLTAFITMVFTLRHSLRIVPLSLSGAFGMLGEGMDMIRLGVSFTLAGIIGSGAEMIVRSYLNVAGNLDMVGLYNSAYMLTVTYGGMVFSAMENDYYPRLSAAGSRKQMTKIVNCQIEVALTMLSPMVAALIVFLPIVIPLLFSYTFSPVVPMAQVSVFTLLAKALSMPLCYINLAKGCSLAYLIIEGTYYLVFIFLVIFGFKHLGLIGTGIAITIAHLAELVIVYVYSRVKFGFRFSRQTLLSIMIHTPLCAICYILTFGTQSVTYWISGTALVSIITILSFRRLKNSTRKKA